MKILSICHKSYAGFTPTGGAETMMESILTYMVSQGWDANVAILGRPRGHVVVDGIDVYRRHTDTDLQDLVENTDLIITHLGATPMAKKLGRRFGKKVVQLVHNTNDFTVGFLGSGCDYAIYNSQWVKEFHDNQHSALIKDWTSPKKTYIRHRQTSTWPSMVVHPPVTDPAPRCGGGTQGYITLVNLVPNKGPDIFYGLAQRHPELKFMGVIGGYETNHQVIRDLPNVTIHEHVRDMSLIYGQTSVVLMPSIYESYGKVAIEAAQYGVPTIAAPTPGLQESLNDSGLLCPRDQPDQWDQGLQTVLDQYDLYSSKAYERYAALYNQSREELPLLVQQMEGVLHGAC